MFAGGQSNAPHPKVRGAGSVKSEGGRLPAAGPDVLMTEGRFP